MCEQTTSYERTSHLNKVTFKYLIQKLQIVTIPIYGKEALNFCHPYITDPEIDVNDHIWKCNADFFHCLFSGHFEKRGSLAVFFGNFNSLEETFHD